ncbi:twin-arginine translocase subunit TatC [Yoonia sediminilitoris]|uniref:Sec-independent protein translocase protein TatC n=1 Tax=Yoonia sediminilitoris TaxID=1286148 RepID=A0A2T6KE03_9RHOB|nr:twin-arginine translocase subunit TatC [Yoonia sediminilitoris]PUB13262.1 sec-independent protein translocase protein TatC [Yoonia sediminilitoris]RCW94597.1 sec-independent protein translocase protein TatC [Yoonia sediminilitoris]
MSATDDMESSAAPLIEHLAELRTRLIYSVSAFLVAMIFCFAFGSMLLDFLLGPIERTMRDLGNPNPVMQYTAPQEYFFTLIRISVVGGLMLSFPVIGFQLWRFVAPGLYRNEKQAFLPFMIASPMLFVLGAAFAHYIVVPLAMAFFLGFADLPSFVSAIMVNAVPPPAGAELLPGATTELVLPQTDNGVDIVFNGKVNETLDITLKMIVAFGVCFQLPVLLTLMGTAGLASSRGLRSTRKYAVVGILIVAALVTPPDVTTQLILFIVVYGLYEISIHLVAGVERKKDRAARKEGVIGEGESLFDMPDDDIDDAADGPKDTPT